MADGHDCDLLQAERDLLFDFYIRRAVVQWINNQQGEVSPDEVDDYERQMRDSLTERLAERAPARAEWSLAASKQEAPDDV